MKSATNQQLALIKAMQPGRINEDIYNFEFSKLIGELIHRQNCQNIINEPRLEMAMKECFRLWTSMGRDVYDGKRNAFIEEVVETYHLFTEIATRLQRKFHDRDLNEFIQP